MTNIVPSNQEPTVVQRWLQKLIEANDEHDRRYGLGKYKKKEKIRKPSKPRTRKPKEKQKHQEKQVASPKRDRREEIKLAQRSFKQSRERGFVYLMKSGNGYYKIGISKNIKNRIYGLRRQFPIEIDIVHKIASSNYRNVEKFLHRKYAHKKAEYEWFKLEPEDVQWFTDLRDCDLDWVLEV